MSTDEESALPRGQGSAESSAAPPRRPSAVWIAGILAVAVVALIVALVVVTTSGDDTSTKPSASPGVASAPRQLGGQPRLNDVQYVSCGDPSGSGLPTGTRLVRAGAVVTDSYVLMTGEFDGVPLRPTDAQGGDWHSDVDLKLWQPMDDGSYELLYRFVLGYVTGGGLIPGTGHGGGLIDPAKTSYFIDGNSMGVTVERSALSAIESLDSLAFSAEALPSIHIDNGNPPSQTGILAGWEERSSQSCPGGNKQLRLDSFATLAGIPSNSAATVATAPVRTTPVRTTPEPAPTTTASDSIFPAGTFPTQLDPITVNCVGPLVGNDFRPLEPCQKGVAIETVQNALVRLGYDIDVDGQYGQGTANAVQVFQLANDLPQTGVVDDATWNALGLNVGDL